MGFITDAGLARTNPAFLVEASRLFLTDEVSARVGLLTQGDVAVVDADLDELPWVKLPSGSRVRIIDNLDASTLLTTDGFFRVEMTAHDGTVKTMATRCPEGSAVVHLHVCGCKHWTVTHRVVHLHVGPSEDADEAGTPLSQGDLLCPGPTGPGTVGTTRKEDASAQWVQLGRGGAIWRKGRLNSAPAPPRLRAGCEAGYALKVHNEHGKLLTLAKAGKAPPDASKARPDVGSAPPDAGNQAQHSVPPPAEAETSTPPPASTAPPAPAPGEPSPPTPSVSSTAQPALPAPARRGQRVGPLEVWREVEGKPPLLPWMAAAKIQKAVKKALASAPRLVVKAWRIVSSSNTGIRAPGSWEEGNALLELLPGDVVVQFRDNIPSDANMWAALRAGDQIYRHGELYAAARSSSAHLMVCDSEGLELAQPWEWLDLDAVYVQTCSGFGTPWVVVHKQVIVRLKPSTGAQPLGLALQSDVVGEGVMGDANIARKARKAGWLQLEESPDVRQRDTNVPEPVHMAHDSKAGWMLTKHPQMGQLLKKGDDLACSLSTPGLLLSPTRRGLYTRIMEVCHRRIWVDNKDTLWEGKESKIPPRSTLEAKLFHKNVTVFHARSGTGPCVGGALVQQFDVPAALLEETLYAGNSQVQQIAASDQQPEIMPVGYIDCFATERGSHAGASLWDAICRLPYCILACHSVLTERTVDFWRSCGMHRADPEREEDRKAFGDSVLLHSQGRVQLDLRHVAEALPKSALPLFVRVNSDAVDSWRPRAEAGTGSSSED